MTRHTTPLPEGAAAEGSPRPAIADTPLTAGDSPASIDEAMIARLVDAFYARARVDAVLGPVFSAHVGDWPRHLARIAQFWSSVLLSTGTYTGSPMQRHSPLPIDGSHFQRWLALFEETARVACPPDAAERFIAAAQRMARSLQLARAPLPRVRSRPGSEGGNAHDASSASSSRVGDPSSTAAARIAALRALLPEPGNDAT